MSIVKDTKGKFVRVGEWLCVRNGRVYGVKKVRGKTVRQVAPIQGLAALDGRGRPTAELKRWVKRWGEGLENAPYYDERGGKKVPTIGELFDAYVVFAEQEFLSNGSPAPSTLSKYKSSFDIFVRTCGLSRSDLITSITRERIDLFVSESLARGLIPLTVYGNLRNIRSFFGAWVMERYAAKGWEVTLPNFPRRRGKLTAQKVYQRPPEELRERTMQWYRSMEKDNPMIWVAASLMLQFGMRNCDAARLKWENIVREDGKWVLGYTPKKTKNSSGRRVHCAMSDAFYERLRANGGKGEYVIDGALTAFEKINVYMFGLGWKPPQYYKRAYELRKMCIDRIYRTYGVEAAVQVSGDDIKTILRFYADPSRANMEAIDIE